MDKCEKCNSTNIIKGWLSSEAAVVFTENSAKFMKKQSPIFASACKDCGSIFDLKLQNPEKFRSTK